MKLRNASLKDLPASIRTPGYDRSRLTPGIVHIGVGNFHRAHQSWYLHRLFQTGADMDWAIVGAGVRPPDAQMRERLAAQDYLYTLIELDPDGKSAEVVGSMVDFVPVADGNGPLIARMADPATRIVTLTVTEGGYYIRPDTKQFDADQPDILYDAANPNTPRTAFGAMVAALRLRQQAGLGPFTGLSCDNLQGNGTTLRQAVVSLARMSDPGFAEWIEANCTFPNSMVDCIVPATGTKELELARQFGIDDAAPVTHENFRQWVIEDAFCAGRPDLGKVGATLSTDVHDFEKMKLRLLNGSHQVIATSGEILGIKTISETMAHPKIHGLFRKVAEQEIAPHVAAVPGFTPADYIALIERRFANPEIVDTTRRVAFDGSSRQPGFVIPSIRDAIAAGAPISGLALVSAIWARYCFGRREDGSAVEPNDPNWSFLTTMAQEAASTPSVWLQLPGIYGDVAGHEPFASAFAGWLTLLHRDGVVAAIDTYLAGGTPA